MGLGQLRHFMAPAGSTHFRTAAKAVSAPPAVPAPPAALFGMASRQRIELMVHYLLRVRR